MDRNKENIYNGNPTGELSLAGLEAFVKSKDATTESSETSPKGPSLEGLNDFVETAKAQRPYNMLYSSLTDVGKAIVKGTTPSSDVDPYLQHKMAAPATFTIDVPSKPQPLYDANNYAYYLQKKHNTEQEKLRNDMLSPDAISQFGSPQMHIDQGERMYYKDVADAAYEINKGLGLSYIGEDGRTYKQGKSNWALRTEYGKTDPEASGYEFNLGLQGYATEQIAKEAAEKAQELAKQYTNGEAYTKVNGTTYSQNDLANYFFGQIMEMSHNQRIQVDTDYQDYIFYKTYGKTRKDVMRERVAEIRNELKALQHQAGDDAYWDKKHEVESYLASGAGGVETIFRIPRTEALAAEELAEKPYDDLLEQLNAWEQNDFSSAFASAFDWANFFTMGMADVIGVGNINNALENASKGYYLSDSEKALVKMVQLTQELQSYRDKLYAPQSTWSMIGEGLGGTAEVLPEFALGMIATGGIGSGVKYKAVQAGKRYMANKTIANAAGVAGHGAVDLGKWVGVNYARGMVAAPVMPMFYEGVLDGYNSQYHFEGDKLVYTPKNKATIWAGAYIDTVNEFASEGMGATIGDVVGLGLKGTGRMMGITKKANKSVTGATTRKFLQAPKKESTKKLLKDFGYGGSLTGEWTGEMLGDFMSQWQRYMVGAEYDFEHFKDFDSWLTTIGVSAIMGGTMTTLGGGMNIYQETKYAKDIAQNRERALGKIEDVDLRDKLLMLSEVDDPMLAASELADYFKTHNIDNASDKAYALDYITLNSQLKVLMGDVQEQERMVKFETKRAEIEGKAYHGADGKSTRNVITVRDTEGNAYYVLKGDMANKEAMLELMDVNTGEMTTKVASAVTKPETASVDSLLINAYGNMFSLEEEVSHVKDVTGALSSVEKPTMEHVETTAMQLDITLPKKGDVVTMVDGKTAEITEDLGDGTYIAQRKASLTGLSETITLPFDAIRSNDSLTAKAQEAILNSGVDSVVNTTSAPQPNAEVQTPVESATPQPTTSGVSVGAVIVAPNGEQARVVEVNDDGTVTLNYNLNEGASMADAAIEVVRMDDLTKADGSDASANVPTTVQTEMPAPAVPQPVAETPTTDAVDAAQNVEVVPTQQDGTVDFDAIEDAAQCAQMMAAMLGGPENALAIVEESIEAVKTEMDKAVKAKAPTINEGVAKQNKISEIKARLIRYEQIAFELEQMMKPAEAKSEAKAESVEHEVGLVENEHTAGLPEGMRKSIDEMAKRAKVRIEFVDERIKGDAEQKGNLIRVSTRNRTKAVEVLVGHELLHYMKSKMPEAYKVFKEAVIAFIGEDKFAKEVAHRKKAYAAQNVELNDEAAAEEIVADYAGYLVQGRDVFEKFIEPKKSDNVFLRGLKKGLEYIRNIFGANGMTKQVKAVDAMVDALNTLINATVEGKDIEKREETTAETTKNEEATAEEAKGEDGKTKTKHSLKAQPSLVGVHNISLDKLRKVIKMGGLANPSVAVIDVDKQTHDDYGEYSLILPKNMVDARQGKNAGTWAGDAWTPTYPQIVKRMNDDKAYSRFHKDIEALPEAMRNRVRLDFDSFMDGRDVGSLAYWYLYEKGFTPALEEIPSRYSDEVINALSEATNGTFNLFNLTPEERAKCLDVYIDAKYNGDKAAYEAEVQSKKERLIGKAETVASDRVKKWAQDKVDELNEYGFDYSEVSDFVRDVETDMRNKGTVNVEATIRAAKEQIENGNLIADYNIWLESLDERYGIKEYIFNGYTNNGDRKYLPHTVENASKWMKKQGRNGAVATFPSFGVFIANAIPKMTTLESIRKRKEMLGKSNEAFEAFKDKWLEVYHELGNKLQPDAKGFDDYGYWRLIEAVGKNNPKEFIKKEYGIELSEEDMAKFNDMVNAIRTEYPARYFETKFERPLQLSDFVAAVVPNDMPLDVESRLKNAGVEVIEYEREDNASRAEAMQKASEMENVRFSLMDDAQAAAEVVPYLEAYNTDLTTFNALVNKVKDVAEKYPNATWPERFLKENYEDENEDDFINRLKWTISNYAIEEEKDYSEEKQTIEETFGGIWIENTEEFAKFVSAVNKSPFEEDGEGIAYTDNYFYAYYRNINGEPVPYASVYMNEAVSQDIVKKVIKEINDVRTSGRVKERIDSALERIRDAQSQDNANDGDNSGASSRRRNERLGFDILRKGRYFDNPSLYVKTSRTDGRGDVDYRYSLRETDPEILEQLNNGNTIKVYRAMQVIDGELYPPMSARVGGKLRAPIALGEWERAEERPDLADDKGYFKLDKGNSTSLKARYNPYIHTSLTPLNDQFSSAQDRPNLVTVEVEIPESELTSGYKADKAKDAVGKLEWKAGVVQSQLTGTRTVILSRWDRPIRIVPDSEVAQRIVEMFGDTKVIMPSNVVTPSLREELEKLGVPFRETDNQGKSRYSLITPEMDASYLDAVERGDMATAQRMVMEAAEKAGYTIRAYHGTPNKVYNPDWQDAVAEIMTILFPKEGKINLDAEYGTDEHRKAWNLVAEIRYYYREYREKLPKTLQRRFERGITKPFTVFDTEKMGSSTGARDAKNGFFFSPNPLFASSFRATFTKDPLTGVMSKTSSGDGVLYDVFIKPNNLLDLRSLPATRSKTKQMGDTDGYDVVINKVKDGRNRNKVEEEIMVKDPTLIKSADPVTYDDAGNVIPLSERFNPKKEDIRYSLMQPTNEEVTFDNFFKNTSAVFESMPKSEVPQREPDYTSERWDGFGVSSRYWYGEDGLGKYVIRESNHWSDYPQGERTREAFEAEPYNKRYTRISSCRWALAVSKEQVTTEKDSYLDGDKMYGKAYLDEFTKWEDVRYSLIGEKGAAMLDQADESMRRLEDLAEAREMEGARRSIIAPTFYSNAQYTVQNIKQEKATPEQWLKMIEKNGGLKAGEDKWLGLSDWLKASDKKTLTKDEVLQYIAENDIQIEEVSYGEPEYISENEICESDAFSNLVASLTDYDEDDNPHINQEQYKELQNADSDFLDGFSLDYWGEGLDIDDKMAAARYLGLLGVDNEINNTRLQYTTQGLTKKKEIALVVPTIEPYNQSDEIHFGDAGEGRAVAWIRFGDTIVQEPHNYSPEAKEWNEPYKNINNEDVFKPVGSAGEDAYVVHRQRKDVEGYVIFIKDKPISIHTTLEEARIALNDYYKQNPLKLRKNKYVLVIDEIQSKRHQDGREKGYISAEEKAKIDAIRKQRDDLSKLRRDWDYRTGQAWRQFQSGEISEQEYNRLWDTQFDAERKHLDEIEKNINTEVNVYDTFDKIPSAPFEKNWAELAFKRMLRYAAENGYDYVAWTTGDQQADRYDIGSVVKDIVAYDTKDADGNPIKKMKFRMNNMGTYNIATNIEGVIVKGDGEMKEGMRLSDITGKPLAEKIMNGEGEDAMVFENGKDIEAKSLEGEELHIGNEGMKAFYDQMLPSFVKKYTKKWGAEVGEVTMPDLEENNTMHAVNVTDSMRESVMQGQPKFSLPTDLLTDFAEEFNSLQKEYESLDRSTIDYKHPFRVRKREVVQDYVNHVTEVLGLPCETFVLDAEDEAQIREAYDRYEKSHSLVSQKYPKRARKLLTFDEFNADFQETKEEIGSGCYFKGTDLTLLIITGNDAYNAQNGYLQVCIHENVHGVMDTLRISDFEKKVVLAEGLKFQSEAVNKILEGYENDSDAYKGEELIAFAINSRLMPEYGNLLLDYFEDNAQLNDIWKSYNLQLPLRLSLIRKILNYLKDGYNARSNNARNNGGSTARFAERAGSTERFDNRFRSRHLEKDIEDERGGNKSSINTSYSLSDIPFFDAEGKVIDMSVISEAKALEMIDGRVRDMMAYDYDKSVIDIANQAKKDRRATRAYYAEERRKRRGNNEAPRTNAAKIDELFADTNINSLPLEVQALIFVAEGRAKIRWADKDGKRGLASELGLANSASDKAAMKSVWSGAEQSFDEVVHGWWESINGYERGIDTQDLRNALIEALMSFPSAKAAMRELQTQYDAIATAEREALEEIDRREAADLDRVKREYEERSARFEMSEGDEREAMREMAVEHYSSQPLSAADEALEELTDKLDKMERRAERLMLEQKSGYRELAESIEKSKEVIIRTLEHLRMFSGMEQIHIDEVAKLINMTRTARSKRQVEAVATKAKNLIQRIAIRKARENMRRLLDLKLSNVEVIQQILKESNTLPREERDALLRSLWKVSRNGWRATKAVHPDTKEIFKELNDLIKEYKKSVKDKEVATIKQRITDRLVSLEVELHPDVEVDDKGNVKDNAGLPTDFNDSNRNIALHLFKSYLEVEAKNVAYSEANKTLRETDKGSEKFGEALSNMYVAREDYLSALKQFNATLEDVIVNGKDKLRDFNIEKEKHEVALRSMAIKAIGGKKASAQGKRGNALQLARAGINITVNSPYWTFETVLERIDRLSPYKKGEFYNYFMRKYTDANAKLYTSYSAHMESIGSAMARCFPDMAKQFGIIGRNPYEIYKAVMRKAEATALDPLKYKEDREDRELQLTVANAMYIVAMWRQPRYREAMEKRGGITQEQINNIMQSINKEHAGYINFMDWVNTALLPNTRLEYDEVYRKLNGGSLAKEENYFPAKVVTHEDVKLDKDGKGQLPSSPSALKERISHNTMPQMGTDYFKVLEAHIQDMDKWAAFAELTADLNVILSSDEFRRRLNEFMPGLGGNGGGKGSLYKMLYDTALIATGNYHHSKLENAAAPIQKAWATSNIAFRFWTAVKQISSVSVGITEHVYFAKHMAATATVAGIAYEWERAMALSPSLRYRWQSKAAGMEALMRETSRGDGYAHYRGGVVKTYDALKDMADKAVKLGMTPNALVDAIACSILVNSVYDKAIHDMTKGKREATEEERKEAIRKAEMAFNSTQQSSEGAYLSAAQANPLYAPLTTYMNASYALHRKRMSGIHELWKLMASKEYRRFLNDEYGVDAAKISAKDAFADIIRGIVGDLSFAAMGWGLMEVMSTVYEWLGGDGDDDDTEAEKQAFFESYWLPVFNGFLGGSQITSLFQGYDTSMTPAYDELLEDVRGIFDDKGDWRVEVAQAATKYGLGIDIKSLYRIGAGLENMVAEEKDENAGSILMFLNAPNKYVKAFVGDRREGETMEQYQTRIMRLYTLFDKVMYEELYDENGKYIGEGAPSMIMSQTQAKALNKEYEAAYLKDVVVRNGGWDEYRTMMSTEMLYKDICEFIGVTPDAQPSKTKLRNTVYSTGEYVAPVYGLSQKEHGELLSAESYVAGAHHNRTRWVGDDEGYYGLLKEEYRKKSELIDKYNEYIK